MTRGDRADGLSELSVGDAGRLILSGHPAALPGRTPEQAVGHYARLGSRTLLTLLTVQELRTLGLEPLQAICASNGLEWLHAPINDHQAPDAGFESWWEQNRDGLHRQIDEGVAVAIHCWGGKGRTGTIAARLLIERGLAPEAAISAVRQCRPGAIETTAQVEYLLRLPPQRRN
jgi:protein-tyrosine phosphatase